MDKRLAIFCAVLLISIIIYVVYVNKKSFLSQGMRYPVYQIPATLALPDISAGSPTLGGLVFEKEDQYYFL